MKGRPALNVIEGGASPVRSSPPAAGLIPRFHAAGREAGGSLAEDLLRPLRETERRIDRLLAGDHGPVEGAQREVLRAAVEATDFLSSLLSLLGLSERRENDLEEPEEFFDIRFPVWDVVDDHAPVARSKRIALTIALPKEPVPILGRREPIRTLLDFALREHLYSAPRGTEVAVIGEEAEEGARVRFERRGRSRRSAARPNRAGLALTRSLMGAQGGSLRIGANGEDWILLFPSKNRAD